MNTLTCILTVAATVIDKLIINMLAATCVHVIVKCCKYESYLLADRDS